MDTFDRTCQDTEPLPLITGIGGNLDWTLDSGLWTLDSGLWTPFLKYIFVLIFNNKLKGNNGKFVE